MPKAAPVMRAVLPGLKTWLDAIFYEVIDGTIEAFSVCCVELHWSIYNVHGMTMKMKMCGNCPLELRDEICEGKEEMEIFIRAYDFIRHI